MHTNIHKKIGLMGGTFDPIHIGHLIMAEKAYEQFELDSVLFLPSGNPPHKQNRVGAEDEQRKEMVHLAISGNPNFQLDNEEMERAGFTYTYETLQLLNAAHPDNTYYFIIGADSLLSFDTWKEPAKICQNCILLAAVRDGLDFDKMEEAMEHLRKKYNARIERLDLPNIDISSSMIREKCRTSQSIRYYVPDAVREYIIQNDIYAD